MPDDKDRRPTVVPFRPVADKDSGGIVGALRRSVAHPALIAAAVAVIALGTLGWLLVVEHYDDQARRRASTGPTYDTAENGGTVRPQSAGRPHVCLKDYPAESARHGEQGTTILAFTITDQGVPTDIRIASSSGFDRLDTAAIQCAAAWRYRPAIRHGDPVAVPWKAEVKWVLH